jgi:nucleotide-binding universal stress UspA family protein
MVRQIKRILFTTDLSKSSIEVFEKTIALAAQTGAAITMLHVIEDGSSDVQNRTIHLVDRQAYEKIRNESRDIIKNVLIGKQKTIPLIQNALAELCDQTTGKICGESRPVVIDSIEVRFGNAANQIMEVADTLQCDLIAMGYFKKGSLLKALVSGSAGKSVMQQSKKPLFLVPLES